MVAIGALTLAFVPVTAARPGQGQSPPKPASIRGLAATAATADMVVTLTSVHLPPTYSSTLAISLALPPGYSESAPGVWSGSTYQDAKKPTSTPKPATLKWWAKLDHSSATAQAAAQAYVIDPETFSQVKASAEVAVPRLLADGQTAMITGYTLLLQSGTPLTNAQFEGVVALPLGLASPSHGGATRAPYFAVVRFIVRNPASDRYAVGSGSTAVPAPTWNAQQIAAALAGVKIQGSMPPASMTATTRILASRCCRARITGVVSDSLGQPVAGARVSLLREALQTAKQKAHHAKRRLLIVSSVQTSAAGSYVLFVPIAAKASVFELTAQLAKSAITRGIVLPGQR